MNRNTMLKAGAALALALFVMAPSIAQAPSATPSQANSQFSCPMGGPGPHAMMGPGPMGPGMMGDQSGASNWQEMREQMHAMRQEMQGMHQEMMKLRQEMRRPR